LFQKLPVKSKRISQTSNGSWTNNGENRPVTDFQTADVKNRTASQKFTIENIINVYSSTKFKAVSAQANRFV
jgi:hypothetical protein